MTGISPIHLRDYIINPTLMTMGAQYSSPYAVELLLGTAAQESHMGHYLRQLNNGPAVGIYQMEPDTYHDILDHFVSYKDDVIWMLKRFGYARDVEGSDAIQYEPAQRMVWDLQMATIFCRLHYYRVSEPISRDLQEHAMYWKQHYNTVQGKGTVTEFIHNWNRFLVT